MFNYISTFNPYNMDDETVLALATGRRKILAQALQTLEDNFQSPNSKSHLLIYGPRGMGKSFFLKYLSIHFAQTPIFEECRFVSFPEEQSNIKCTSDFINMALAGANKKGFETISAVWEETDEIWEESLQTFQDFLAEKRKGNPNFILVVVMENLNEFLDKLRSDKKSAKIKEARFRHLLERQDGFVLIGASPRAGIDGDYDKRIFKAWKRLSLNPWTSEDYQNYFDRRYQLEVERTGIHLTEAQLKLRQDKLRAISKFTGGSPRMAVVLSNLLMTDDVISTAKTLYGLIEDLTPYYQNLTSAIPPRPRQLFDTLIRLEENKSQSEIAEHLKTTQNSISRHFLWLQENGYVIGTKRKSSRHFSYKVTDRIYVLYYKDRELYHGQNYTPVWLLSDFLVVFYQVREFRVLGVKLLEKQPSADAFDFARVGLKAAGMPQDMWPKHQDTKKWIEVLYKAEEEYNLKKEVQDLLNEIYEGTKLENEEDVLLHIQVPFEKLKKMKGTYPQEKGAMVVLRQIGGHYMDSDYYKISVTIFEHVLSVAKELDDSDNINRTLFGLGFSHNNLTNYSKAIHFFEESLPYWESSKNVDVYATTLENYGNSFNLKGDFLQAIEVYKKALEIRTQENNLPLIANIESVIGWCAQNLGLFEMAIENYQKANIRFLKEKKIINLASNLQNIGLCYEKLNQFHEAIEMHQQAAKHWIKENNTAEHAWNLGRIGWCMQELNQFQEAFKVHQQAAKLWKKEKNIAEHAWNLGQIGWCLKELNQFEQAIKAHQHAVKLRKQENNIASQAWNLGQIGWCLKELNQFQEAVEIYQQAAKLWKKEKNIAEHAWNLGQIGWCLKELNQFKKAIEAHQQALELRKQENNIASQAWNLERISWCWFKLFQFQKAIEIHQQALKFHKKENNKVKQSWNLGRIGWCHRELGQDKKSLKNFKIAVEFTEIKEESFWLYGQLAVQHFLLHQEEAAWKILEDYQYSKEKIFKEYGDAVIFTERRHGLAKAFAIGNEILNELKDRNIDFDYPLGLSMFFADLLDMKCSNELYLELCEAALEIFSDNKEQVVLTAALRTVEYIAGGKEEAFLEQLSPDMAIAIKAIVEEGKL